MRDTACRIRHRDSGAVTEAQEHRTFEQNRRAAFLRLTVHGKFRMWLAQATHAALGHPLIANVVESMMAEQNLLVEVKDERGRWVIEPERASRGHQRLT